MSSLRDQMSHRRPPGLLAGVVFLLAATSIFFSQARAQTLSPDQLDAVKARLAEGATHSWEIGTRAQALLEYDAPTYSVLNDSSLPPPQGQVPSSIDQVISIARSVVSNLTTSDGPQPLMDANGGAAGDPASIGVAVLLANWTGAGERDNVGYASAAQGQLEFLLTRVPKTSDGAISHRMEEVQLWSDFVYMVPPFLAYYGVLTANETLIQAAYDQCRLYRQYLVDDDAGGMWKHIVLGRNEDLGHWTTGNGWAAAGMLRVLGTIQHSQYSDRMKDQARDLTNWVAEIHNGIYPHLQPSGLFLNYASDSTSFEDAAGTALLASSVYRLALLSGIHTHLPLAERSRAALFSPSPSSSSSSFSSPSSWSSVASPSPSQSSPQSPQTLTHFTPNMWLTPVVDPLSIGRAGAQSPEAQAFVLDAHAAWRDWTARGAPGANGARAVRGVGVGVAVGYLGVGVLIVLGTWL